MSTGGAGDGGRTHLEGQTASFTFPSEELLSVLLLLSSTRSTCNGVGLHFPRDAEHLSPAVNVLKLGEPSFFLSGLNTAPWSKEL